MKNVKLFCCLLLLTAPLSSSQIKEKIIIFYGPNDSHSKSWVRESAAGVVGVISFQHFDGSHTNGILSYKAIAPGGSVSTDAITADLGLEKAVLLFDASSQPHVFAARSDALDQTIGHYWKTETGEWRNETVVHFYNEGGKFIYELSADSGPDHSFHLLVLKTRSNIDSDDFMEAWRNSHLYHLTNATGKWEKQLIHNYNTAYTYDMYVKSSCRQDIKVDKNGFVHVVFSEQLDGADDPSRLLYATNRPGHWQKEVALSYDPGSRDDAGWFPSLGLNRHGVPYISCLYVDRVHTHSATECRLLLLRRKGPGNWLSEVVARQDDGYYGGDGRNFTGALSHLVLDSHDMPHIIFSDIASTHWPGTQRLNVGNIRYAVLQDGRWKITTIHRQPRPAGFFDATEMLGMCLVVSEKTKTVRVVGQELLTTDQEHYACRLLDFSWEYTWEADPNEALDKKPKDRQLIRR